MDGQVSVVQSRRDAVATLMRLHANSKHRESRLIEVGAPQILVDEEQRIQACRQRDIERLLMGLRERGGYDA